MSVGCRGLKSCSYAVPKIEVVMSSIVNAAISEMLQGLSTTISKERSASISVRGGLGLLLLGTLIVAVTVTVYVWK